MASFGQINELLIGRLTVENDSNIEVIVYFCPTLSRNLCNLLALLGKSLPFKVFCPEDTDKNMPVFVVRDKRWNTCRTLKPRA